ncbi:hypothetical protein KKB18_04165 [bacterium]|nr:hypothetical protein [bacterium]
MTAKISTIIIVFSFFAAFPAMGEESWTYLSNSNYVRSQVLNGNNLWLATSGGVVKFDISTGEMQQFDRATGLLYPGVDHIVIDGKGNIWCSSTYALCRYDGNKWEYFAQDNGLLPANSYGRYNNYVLAVDKNGDLWTSANSGIYHFNGDEFEQKFNFVTPYITFDNDGSLWRLTYEDGAYKYENGEWEHFSTENGLPDNFVYRIFFDSSGNIWFVSELGNIARYDGINMDVFDQNDGYIPYAIDLSEDSEGNLWFCNDYGMLLKFNGNEWSHFDRDFLYPDLEKEIPFYCNSISIDDSNIFWVGTNNGIIKITYPNVSCYELPSDYPIKNKPTALGTANDGTVWVGDSMGGISSFDGQNWITQFKYDWNIGEIKDFKFNSKGEIWVAYGRNLKLFFNDSWELIDVPIGEVNTINSILLDQSDNLWVTTAKEGVFYFDGEKWKNYIASETDKNGPISTRVEDGTYDNDGNLWFVGYLGVSKYDWDKWTWYTKDNGLIYDLEVWAVLYDSDGFIWFGTDDGLSCFDGVDKWKNFTTDDGLVSNSIYKIFQDSKGNLWFGTGSGVSKYDGEKFTSYTIQDGLYDNYINDITEDKNGNIWFATNYVGISIIHPDTSPNYSVLTLSTDKGRYRSGDTITLSVEGENKGEDKHVDIWLVMIDPAQNVYFALAWNDAPAPVISNIFFPAGFNMPKTTLSKFNVPNILPPISSAGTYIFAVGLADVSTTNFFHISTAQIEILP